MVLRRYSCECLNERQLKITWTPLNLTRFAAARYIKQNITSKGKNGIYNIGVFTFENFYAIFSPIWVWLILEEKWN